MKPMGFLSIGAGAIGTYIGGSLALSGHQVTFLERPETASRISQLNLRKEDRTQVVNDPVFVTSLEKALSQRSFDAALFATKSFDTAGAMRSFAPFANQLPPFICLQNGVENEALIAEAFGAENVIPATVTTAIGKDGPGSITVNRLRGVGLSSQHPLSRKLFKAFQEADLNPALYDIAPAMKWSKLLTNLIANATSAILGMTPNAIFSDTDLFRVEIEAQRETLAVMKAMSIPIVDLPGTPVKLLSRAVRLLPLPVLRPLLKKAVVGGRGEKMPSFYIDIQAGRKQSEVKFLNGAVARFGVKYGVAVPVNQFLTETLMGIAAGRIPKEKYSRNPTNFLSDLQI